jgi:2-succinyl-6-hydroxy-2,4-cyclohexadiene-1-carboxylate synthase
VGVQAAVAGQSEDERRRPRAGRGAGVGQAAADELIDEGGDQHVGVGRGNGQDGRVGEDLLLLHGFSGTHRAYDAVIAALPAQRYRPLAPDLPGHGASGDRRPIDFPGCVAELAAAAPPTFVLCGYSLGGRIALHLALAHPRRVTRLVLVATTAGIDDPEARAERRREDEALADRLEREPLEEFVRRWRRQPLFAAEPEPVRAAASADQRRNSTAGLAAGLRGLGSGVMEPVWDRLGELAIAVTVVVGERDEKFTGLGRRLAEGLPDARLEVVDGAGHGLLWEAPEAVAAAIARGGSAAG